MSAQAVSILARAANTVLAVPLDIKIHEGLVFTNRETTTLLDKLIQLVNSLKLSEPFYLVADPYYASGKTIKPLLKQNNLLISRAKSNCTASYPAPKHNGKRGRGRPPIYGKTVHLINLFRSTLAIQTIPSPLYDDDAQGSFL